jgi:hypothetical protein
MIGSMKPCQRSSGMVQIVGHSAAGESRAIRGSLPHRVTNLHRHPTPFWDSALAVRIPRAQTPATAGCPCWGPPMGWSAGHRSATPALLDNPLLGSSRTATCSAASGAEDDAAGRRREARS